MNKKLLEVIFSGTPHALGPTPFIRIPYFSHISALALIKALSWISISKGEVCTQAYRPTQPQLIPDSMLDKVTGSITTLPWM